MMDLLLPGEELLSIVFSVDDVSDSSDCGSSHPLTAKMISNGNVTYKYFFILYIPYLMNF